MNNEVQDLKGKVVGQYTLLKQLGEGGMAEVWLARHRSIDRLAAVKFLNAKFAGSPDVEQRFLDEAKAQERLRRHPHIVELLDYTTEQGRSYLIMGYVEGGALDHRLASARGPLPLAETLAVAKGVLSALGHAHSQDVIHRDLKPSNILLGGGTHPYLTDFGIALVVNAAKRRTTIGTLMGTAHYMSPEQFAAPLSVDRRSDIYSFGCVLYEMITGRPPFGPDNATESQLCLQHVQQAPRRPSEYNDDVPPALEEITLRCLAKAPADRFDTCAEIETELDRISSRQGGRTPTFFEQPGRSNGASQGDFEQHAGNPPSRGRLKDEPSTETRPQPGFWTAAKAGIAAAVLLLAGLGYMVANRKQPEPAKSVSTTSPVIEGPANTVPSNPDPNPPKTTTPKIAGATTTVSLGNKSLPHLPPVAKPKSPSRDAGPSSGELDWQGMVMKNQEIVFSPNGSVSTGTFQGTMYPQKPVHVQLDQVSPLFTITQVPTAEDGWRLRVRSLEKGMAPVTIKWSLAQ